MDERDCAFGSKPSFYIYLYTFIMADHIVIQTKFQLGGCGEDFNADHLVQAAGQMRTRGREDLMATTARSGKRPNGSQREGEGTSC